jgi:hypothetical protein
MVLHQIEMGTKTFNIASCPLGLGARAGPNLRLRKSLTFQETTLPDLEMVKLKKLKRSKLSSYG